MKFYNDEYKDTISFGKVAYTGSRKSNEVKIDICLSIKNNKPVFTASAEVWQANHNDIYMGGQCLDDIYTEYKSQIKNRKLYEAILALWEKWHLNDTHAGCVHQDKLGWKSYDEHPSEPCPTCGYKYGTAWTYREIDKKDLYEIMQILHIDPLAQSQITKL